MGMKQFAWMAMAALLATSSAFSEVPEEAAHLVVTADFNRDGIADLAEVSAPGGDNGAPRVLTVLLGRPGGGFLPNGLELALTSEPKSLVTGDFNGDGIPDLLVGDGDGGVTEFLGDGTGKLVSAGEIAHLGSVSAIAVADFNHDGTLDLAVSDSQDSVVTVLLGGANGSFHTVWSFPLPTRGKVFRVFTADFNGDGLPDLAVTNDDGSFQVMLNNGNGTFTYAPQLSKLVDPNAHCAT
jgi:hypothetical protein